MYGASVIGKIDMWSVAVVGVGMLRGVGIPLLENKGRQRLLASWFLGFLGFLVSWFGSFLASWFQRLLVSWFLGFLVSWLLGFLVSWFRGFLISWFENCLISKFIGTNFSWLRSFNYPTLPKFHFMFSGRYWSPIHDFQEVIRRIVFFRRPSFTKKQNCRYQNFEIPERILLNMIRDFFVDYLKYSGVSKDE